MIVVPVKEGENIEKALKKFKRKFEKTGIVKELRSRQQFDKPSVVNRLKKERAVYVQKLHMDTAIRHPSFAEASPPICKNGVMLPNLVKS